LAFGEVVASGAGRAGRTRPGHAWVRLVQGGSLGVAWGSWRARRLRWGWVQGAGASSASGLGGVGEGGSAELMRALAERSEGEQGEERERDAGGAAAACRRQGRARAAGVVGP
jgi:hypothetical protein